MMQIRARRARLEGPLFVVVAIALVAVVAGCGGQEGDVPQAGVSADTEHGDQAVAQSEMMTILASADAADGTVDKVVSKCAGCKLHMDGSADYALEVEGYEMHFCGDDCKSHVAEDTEAAVLALKE